MQTWHNPTSFSHNSNLTNTSLGQAKPGLGWNQWRILHLMSHLRWLGKWIQNNCCYNEFPSKAHFSFVRDAAKYQVKIAYTLTSIKYYLISVRKLQRGLIIIIITIQSDRIWTCIRVYWWRPLSMYLFSIQCST